MNIVGDVGDFEVKYVDYTQEPTYTVTGTGIPDPEENDELAPPK